MTPREVADYLRVELQTLHYWRHERRGPRTMRVGKLLRYRRSDVDAWLERNRER